MTDTLFIALSIFAVGYMLDRRISEQTHLLGKWIDAIGFKLENECSETRDKLESEFSDVCIKLEVLDRTVDNIKLSPSDYDSIGR